MSDPHAGEHAPHPPAAPGLRIVPWQFLVRGGLLAVVSLGAVAAIAGAFRQHAALGALVAVPGVPAAVLAAWAAVIQFTGGERMDDHPWV